MSEFGNNKGVSYPVAAVGAGLLMCLGFWAGHQTAPTSDAPKTSASPSATTATKSPLTALTVKCPKKFNPVLDKYPPETTMLGRKAGLGGLAVVYCTDGKHNTGATRTDLLAIHPESTLQKEITFTLPESIDSYTKTGTNGVPLLIADTPNGLKGIDIVDPNATSTVCDATAC